MPTWVMYFKEVGSALRMHGYHLGTDIKVASNITQSYWNERMEYILLKKAEQVFILSNKTDWVELP